MLSAGEIQNVGNLAQNVPAGVTLSEEAEKREDLASQGSWVVSGGVGHSESTYMDLVRVGYRFDETYPVEATFSVRMANDTGLALAVASFKKLPNVWLGYGAEVFLPSRMGGDLSALAYVRLPVLNPDAALIFGGGMGYNNIEDRAFVDGSMRFEIVLP